MRRNVAPLALFIFLVYYALLALPKAMIIYCLKGQWSFLKARLNGVGWNLHHAVARPMPSAKRADITSDGQVTVPTGVGIGI